MASVLHKLGCGLPKSGQTGCETRSAKVRELNENLLASAGSAWDDFTPFPPEWSQSPVAHVFTKRAVAVLEEEFTTEPLFLLEDPLISRLVPFWMEALKRAGCAVKPVLVIRNPIEIGDSIRAGSDLSEPLGQMVWLRSVLDAESSTRGMPRFHASFEELRTAWENVAAKAEEALELSWPKPAAKVEFEIVDALRSEPPARKDLEARSITSSLVPSWVREAYKVLNGWARGEEMGAHQRILDSIRAELDTASVAFARLVQAERHNGAKQQHMAAVAEIAALAAANLQANRDLEEVSKALQEQRRQTTLLNAEIYELKSSNDDLEAQLKDSRAELASSRDRRKEMARIIGRRDTELAERYQDLATLQRRLVRFSPSWYGRRLLGSMKKLGRRMSGSR